MTPTLDDLRVALHEQAHHTPYPDVDALVAGARRRVGLARRRRLATLSSVTVALSWWAGSWPRRAQPTGRSRNLRSRGWGASPSTPPVPASRSSCTGYRRVTVLDAPMLAQMKPDYTPSVAAPKGSKIHAATYETVPWQEYPFPPRPTGVRTPVWRNVRSLLDGTPDGTAVSGALNRQIQGPTSAANANDALSIGWPHDPSSRLVLEVQVDTAFPLDPQIVTRPGATVPVPKLGETVSRGIIPQDFTGPDWRVIYEPLVKGR